MQYGSRGRGRPPASNVLQTATLRQFDGLWNPTDTDLNLRSDFARWMTNVERGSDSTLSVRYGYRPSFGHYQSARQPAQIVVEPDSNYIKVIADRWVALGTRVRLSGVPDGDYLGISSTVLNAIHTVVERGTDGVFYVLLDDWTSSGDIVTINGFVQETVSNQPYVLGLEYTGSKLAFTSDGSLLEFSNDTVYALWSPNIGHFKGLIEDTAKISYYIGEQWAYVAFTSNEDLDPNEPIEVVTEAGAGEFTADELNRYFNIVDQVYEDGVYYQVIRLPRAATTTLEDFDIEGRYNLSEDWATVETVSYAQFGQRITFVNGVDKPIVLDWSNDDSASYLVDPSTGSNLNTPVAKYVVAGSSYTIHVGLVNQPGTISISATNTDNTFLGDPGTNDAVEINVAKAAVDANAQPTGAAFHNGLLFVFFESTAVIYRLGVFKDDLHVPELVQVIQSFGCISHRALASIGSALYTVDTSGVVSIQETLVGDSFKPVRLSENITTEIVKAITAIDRTAWEYIHHVYDKRLGRYLLFIPTTSWKYTTFVYHRLEEKKVAGWYKFTNLDFPAVFRDSRNRIYGNIGNVFHIIGNDDDPIYNDNGSSIPFVWETPWLDFKARTRIKTARYLSLETLGIARFKLSLFTDYIYADWQTIQNNESPEPYTEFTLPLLPESEVEYVGGQILGYGGGEQPYGSGRRTNDPRPYTWNARFKVAKLRFSGTVDEPLKFVSVSIEHQLGGIYR